jgi:hypothetical protein
MTEETKQVVKYLRMSPKDSLKRDAADIIEAQAKQIESMKQQQPELYKAQH